MLWNQIYQNRKVTKMVDEQFVETKKEIKTSEFEEAARLLTEITDKVIEQREKESRKKRNSNQKQHGGN